jgi:dCTP deaminase
MPFWSGETLIQRQAVSEIIHPFDANKIDCGAYTLRMGSEVFVTPDRKVSRRRARKKIMLRDREDFSIPPGQFAFLLTKEYLTIPNGVIAFISLKSTIKYLGLVNVSGFHVDPGFRGNLVYAVYNAGPSPIYLEEGKDLFLIWFADFDKPDTAFNRLTKPPQTNIRPELIQGIPGEILSLQSLSQRMETLNTRLFQIIAVGGILYAILLMVFAGLAVDWKKFLGIPDHPITAEAISGSPSAGAPPPTTSKPPSPKP